MELNPKGNTRKEKVAAEVRRILSELLLRGDLIDDEENIESSMISINDVVMSSDLKYAKLFVSSVSNKFTNEDCTTFLRKHSSKLRYHLGTNIRLRFTPDLQFFADNSYETAERIESILKKISVV